MCSCRHQNAKIIITVFVLAGSVFFLFFNLGHYALWDDEATTALYAQSIWRTGDLYALLDHNLIAYNSGMELNGLYNRYMPPLPFYLAAPFVGNFPGSAMAARLPFAICGLLTVGMMLLCLWRSGASWNTWILISIGILCNVSLMLFSRQCRYYSVVMLMSTALAYLYFYRDERLKTSIAIAAASLFLFASHYLCYVAVYSCLIIDYFLWGRKTRPIKFSQLAVIFVPQVLLGGLLLSIFNLFKTKGYDTAGTLWEEKGAALLSTLSDFNNGELGVGILILMAPLLCFYTKNMLRCFVAIGVYLLVIGLLSPPLSQIGTTVRYLAPLIPLCIMTGVWSIQAITIRWKWLSIPLAILAFGTNALHRGIFEMTDNSTEFSRVLSQDRFRSTIIEFTKELISPYPSAYRTTSEWINQQVADQDSIWVMPSYATYPLMYHAPKPVYAWQLQEALQPWEDLPAIHFMYKIPPDYVIAFGPYVETVQDTLQALEQRGVRYVPVKRIDQYWYDLIRPELFWHAFQEIRNYSQDSEAIYIFKRI